MLNFKRVNDGLIDSSGTLKCYRLRISDSKILWTSLKMMIQKIILSVTIHNYYS